jgi:hypothetical protein
MAAMSRLVSETGAAFEADLKLMGEKAETVPAELNCVVTTTEICER